MQKKEIIERHLTDLNKKILDVSISDHEGQTIDLAAGIDKSLDLIKLVQKERKQIFFVGNGGSAGIASHLAIDYAKNGKVNSRALNDSSSLTCLANDYGYDFVFSKQLEYYANEGDLLIAISSSGESKNILNGVDEAKKKNCNVITMSGFSSGNSLRKKGQINFYIDGAEYGIVEVAHLTLLHLILDIKMNLVK